MFGKNDTRHIDLHLPTGWNHCTTEELEAIAAAIIQEQQRVDRYHPFDWQRVKLNAALSINEISTYRNNEISKGDESEWLVKRPNDKEPWPISVGQLLALTDMLSWLDDEKSDKTVFMFPYPELTLRRTAGDGGGGGKLSIINSQLSIKVAGPPPLLDGYTWKEYRWLTDWMQEYMRLSNARRDASTAQKKFLAILFKPVGEPTDGLGGRTAEHTVTSDSFAGFSSVQWQVILFWWSSLMAQLAKKFPRVFKSQPVDKGKRKQQKQDTPWDFYNRVTATIQKYVGGLSSQDVDNQPYGVTLQQLEMMADEAAEMEKLKHKK